MSSGIFAGTPGKQTFSHDLGLLRERKYMLAGKLVSWSIIHGGPGLSNLHPNIFELMLSADADISTEINIIEDIESRANIEKVCFSRRI